MIHNESKTERSEHKIKAAHLGAGEAQILVGSEFEDAGQYEEVMSWYLKAADNGFREADYLIGPMLTEGRGCEKNHMEAIKRFIKIRTEGNDDSVTVVDYSEGLISWNSDYYDLVKIGKLFSALAEMNLISLLNIFIKKDLGRFLWKLRIFYTWWAGSCRLSKP